MQVEEDIDELWNTNSRGPYINGYSHTHKPTALNPLEGIENIIP